MIHYVHVDSSKRDTTLYPYANSYTVALATPIRNVQCIELVSAMIPCVTQNTYTFLNIEEFSSEHFINTQKNAVTQTIEIDPVKKTYIIANTPNRQVMHPFAAIPMDVTSGQYKTFSEKRDFHIAACTFIPRLDRLSIQWTDSAGQFIQFTGTEHTFIIKIHSGIRQRF
jgi:hypothetical protein